MSQHQTNLEANLQVDEYFTSGLRAVLTMLEEICKVSTEMTAVRDARYTAVDIVDKYQEEKAITTYLTYTEKLPDRYAEKQGTTYKDIAL